MYVSITIGYKNEKISSKLEFTKLSNLYSFNVYRFENIHQGVHCVIFFAPVSSVSINMKVSYNILLEF